MGSSGRSVDLACGGGFRGLKCGFDMWKASARSDGLLGAVGRSGGGHLI
uniref:Uncharacterized protein n=1 Tax=Arundo donax TaxID=35708 RepID=A0A0A9ARX6_ARUDO